MNRTAEKTTAYAYDLQSALALECSREDAKRNGTLREWKTINRKVQKLLAGTDYWCRSQNEKPEAKRCAAEIFPTVVYFGRMIIVTTFCFREIGAVKMQNL